MRKSWEPGAMKVLLHICCGPCTIYPSRFLKAVGGEVTGFFFNPNIHPYQEYLRRLETLRDYARRVDMPLLCREEAYPMEEFLRQVVFREGQRCRICYEIRLNEAARTAKEGGFDAFTTTILYSRFQKHSLVKAVAEEISARQGVPFLYYDFRQGWTEGVRLSREWGMYRQQYCGCIYSEKERYLQAPLTRPVSSTQPTS